MKKFLLAILATFWLSGCGESGKPTHPAPKPAVDSDESPQQPVTRPRNIEMH